MKQPSSAPARSEVSTLLINDKFLIGNLYLCCKNSLVNHDNCSEFLGLVEYCLLRNLRIEMFYL